MSLSNLIAETSQSLEASRLELETLLMAVESQRQDILDLEDELHGLRLAASRRGELEDSEDLAGTVVPISPAVDIPGSKAADLSNLSRSDAVAFVLSMTDRPLDRSAIQTRLVTLGRVGDSLDQISLALTNLKRSDRALKAGDGRWRAVLQSSASRS